MKRALAFLSLLLLPVSASAAPFDKSGVDWSKTPAAAPDTAFKPPRAVRTRLANGMSLLVIENRRLPLVTLHLVVKDAGGAQDPEGKSGLADTTADLLDEGAGTLGALALSEAVDRLGASLDLSTDLDAAYVSMSTLARTLEPSLDLFAQVITTPSFDGKEAERVLADRLTHVKLRPDRPREIAALVLRAALYGFGAAYGRPADGYVGDAEKLKLDDARAFYADRWHPRAMTLVVVGDVEAKTVAGLLEARFAAWKPAGKKPVVVKAPAAKPGARLYLVDRPGAEQADVRIGLVALGPKDRRNASMDVLANLLGGTFTSRLNRRLREELGWTYGIRASQYGYAQPAPFVITSALVTEHTVEGVAEVLKILTSVTSADIPADELRKAKLNLIRDLPTRFASNQGTATAFGQLVVQGLPDGHYTAYVARIQKVSGKEVRALAKTVIPTGKLIFVVVGDANTVRAGLEKELGAATMLAPELSAAPPRP